MNLKHSGEYLAHSLLVQIGLGKIDLCEPKFDVIFEAKTSDLRRDINKVTYKFFGSMRRENK